MTRAKRGRDRDPDTVGLTGTWYRCPTHGLRDDAVFLAEFMYCAHEDCSQRVTIAHSVLDDIALKLPHEWNANTKGSRARTPADPEDEGAWVEPTPPTPRRRTRAPAAPVAAPESTPAPAEPPRPVLAPAVVPSAPEPVQVAPRPPATDSGLMTLREAREAQEDILKSARAPREAAPDAPVRGATSAPEDLGDVLRVVDYARRTWTCAVCERRRRGPYVAIAGNEVEVIVCPPCAAGGDMEMRAAAAPLLVRSRRTA